MTCSKNIKTSSSNKYQICIKSSLTTLSFLQKIDKKHSVRSRKFLKKVSKWCTWNLPLFLVYTFLFDDFCHRVWQKKGNNFVISHVHIMTRTKHVCYQLSHTLIGSWRTKGWKLGFQMYTVQCTLLKYYLLTTKIDW